MRSKTERLLRKMSWVKANVGGSGRYCVKMRRRCERKDGSSQDGKSPVEQGHGDAAELGSVRTKC